MSEKRINDAVEENGGSAVKPRRKFNIIAFILCLLAAFVIWLYAVNAEKKDREETPGDAVTEAGPDSGEESELSLGDMLLGEL